ncbi:enoyl-CoA hydratase/isomerase family protein [Arthrobacter sp. TMN-49]
MAELRVERHGEVAVLIIDNPAMRNAVTHAMWQQFMALLQDLAADDGVKVLVVRGAGEHFSAGADIASLKAILHDPATGHHGGLDITAAEDALAAFPKPTIAAIDGYCVGGGWQIAGACDLRLASTEAVFGVTPAKIGIVYPLSGIQRLVDLAGPATAKYLLLSGDFVSAPEALRLGLVTKVLAGTAFWDEISDFAHHLAARSQFSHQAHKELVNVLGASAAEVSGLYERWQQEMVRSADAEIGIAAFLAKETPRFTWVRPV